MTSSNVGLFKKLEIRIQVTNISIIAINKIHIDYYF
jgi:hypothetical protein